jgi:hypothetical protein
LSAASAAAAAGNGNGQRGGKRRGFLLGRQGGGRQHRGQGHAAAGQAALQLLARPGQPPGDRTLLPTETPGGLRFAQPFQATQDEGGPVFLRQLLDLLIQHGLEFAQGKAGMEFFL